MSLLKSALSSLGRSRRPAASPADAPATAAAVVDAGRRLASTGRLPEALSLIDDGLARAPGDASLRIARADVLKAWGRDQEAALDIRRAGAPGADALAVARLQAWAATREGRLGEAIACHRRVLASDPADTETMLALGVALQRLGSLDDALRCLRAAHERSPDDPRPLVTLGHVELARKCAADAEALFRRAVALAADSAAAHEGLGIALAAQDRHDLALPALAEAERLARRSNEPVEAYANIGIGLCETGRVSEGIDVLVDGLRERPNLNAFLQLGPALLSQGRFHDGWRQYEHRWLVEPFASIRANYGVPHWMGQPLEGRTILVRSEQGLGDVFQFVRYLPLLKERGARVLFQPLRGMDAIARGFPGVDCVLSEGERLPALDFYANLMSLPLAFGTTVASIPHGIPYLSPDPARVEKWKRRFASRTGPLVGLAWAGRPTHRHDRLRSMRLEQFAPLLDIEGVRFVGLQKGPAAEQAEGMPERVDWDGAGAELDDLEDAAAVLSLLDLLICVDTGLAHLAGAMGKRVWVMIQTPSEYRWMTGREDTPWYPTMRLFRQDMPRRWEPVVDRVAAELRAWCSDPEQPSSMATMSAKESTNARLLEPPASPPPPLSGIAIAAESRGGFLQFIPDEPRIGRSLEHYGEWLQARLDAAIELVRPGSVLLEAGAGTGVHTLPLARAAGPEGVLLAYESRAAWRRLLEQNLAVHEITTVAALSRALGNERFSPRDESIDDLRLARLDGIKVNEEADAVAILEGAGDTLWRCRPWLLLGSNDGSRLDRAREILREFGYRVWRMDTPLFAATNFNRRDEDVFAGERAHALFALPEEADLRTSPRGCVEWS
jgi:tetratricopeptide (TPR) repeat protein